MLFVFLFNVGGYYVAYMAVKHHSENKFISHLNDELYNEDELIELAIPVSLPYPVEEKDYERVNGKFGYKGLQYQLVKQKFKDNTLYVLCIPDIEQTRMSKSVHEYANMVNDVPASSGKTMNILAKLIKDFESINSNQLENFSGWESKVLFRPAVFQIISRTTGIASPPPEV